MSANLWACPPSAWQEVTTFSSLDADYKVVVKRTLVKAADISNQGRPQHLCVTWSKRIAEEYFAQVLAGAEGVLCMSRIDVIGG